jgi:hypothetical protein
VKFLALSFIASLVAVLPVSAQPSRPPAPPNRPTQPKPKPAPPSQAPSNTNRIIGARCISKIIDTAKKEIEAPCHHLSIGVLGNTTLSFTFNTEQEEFGVGYVVGKNLKRDDKGRTYHEIIGMFVQQNGKTPEIKKAAGICSLDPNLVGNNVAAICIAELPSGATASSAVIK